MERFSTELKNRCIMLDDCKDAVRFSFILRNSISYLNLQLLEYSKLNDHSRTVLEVANDFVCTEEKCRKIFAPSRSVLYNLNLDMPARREYRLHNDMAASCFVWDSCIPHIAKITLWHKFDLWNMSPSIEIALKVSDNKLKILRFLVKSPVMKEEILCHLGPHVMNKFIDCFYPRVTDSVLFKSFIEIFDFGEWITKYEEPEILEFLLYHARRQGRELQIDSFPMSVRMDHCILCSYFSNINSILKYTDAPKFSVKGCIMYLHPLIFLIGDLIIEVFNKSKFLTPQRLHMMLQIFWMYNNSTEAASEALRRLWSSCTAACITYGEIEKAFKGSFADEELTGMYEFYCKSVGEDHSVVETRSLKHLCRTSIRRILKTNFWIPEGVKLTGLPKSLQSYLNLEKNVISTH